jgi:pilus assembly protein Flp/PilA
MLLTAMNYVSHYAAKLLRREEGATLVEYGLLVALIAVACVVAITTLGGGISTLFTGVADDLAPPSGG